MSKEVLGVGESSTQIQPVWEGSDQTNKGILSLHYFFSAFETLLELPFLFLTLNYLAHLLTLLRNWLRNWFLCVCHITDKL